MRCFLIMIFVGKAQLRTSLKVMFFYKKWFWKSILRKYVFGLAFLPLNKVSNGFTKLMEIAPSDECLQYADYMLRNYIGENFQRPLFPPEM